MVNQSARAYFRKLAKLILGLQVADGHGVVLSLDEGASKAVDMILSVHFGAGALSDRLRNDVTVGDKKLA